MALERGGPTIGDLPTPLDDNGEHRERQQWAADAAARVQIDLKRGNPGGYEKLIKAIDDLPGHPESLLTAWQLCSGGR